MVALAVLALDRSKSENDAGTVRAASLSSIVESSDVAYLVARADGAILYFNSRYQRLCADFGNGRIVPPDRLFAGVKDIGAVVYRLSLAGKSGEAGSEVIRLKDSAGAAQQLKIEVRKAHAENAELRQGLIWQIGFEAEGDQRAPEPQSGFFGEIQEMLGAATYQVNEHGQLVEADARFGELAQIDLRQALQGRKQLNDILQLERVEEPNIGLPGDYQMYSASPASGRSEGNVALLVLERKESASVDGKPIRSGFVIANDALLSAVQVAPEGADVLRNGPFDASPVGVVTTDQSGHVVEANAAFGRLLGTGDLVGHLLPQLFDDAVAAAINARLGADTIPLDLPPIEVRPNNGPDVVCQLHLTEIANRSGKAKFVGYLIDTTEQKSLEIQFAQSQKMQAVGQLAGGIAHDFNNMLTGIIGYCDLLLTKHQAGDPSFADIMQIKQNANRAANLVRQLLAFSRQQTLRPRVLWLPDAVADLTDLLKRLVGERVQLDIKHERDLGLVKVDEGQLEQVIINLAVNARDAMDGSGTLAISTSNVTREESIALGHALMPPGEYVQLDISDTGVGIAKEILGKIFEPFFTTKEVGQGTGLGLSMVYGIVKQTGGFIFPVSEVGEGTTFRIYLPRYFETAEEKAKDIQEDQAPKKDLTGMGSVLLVEDEEGVRNFAARVLNSRGYTVFEAEEGESALDVIRENAGEIDLVISDVVMPNMDGPTMIRQAREFCPDAKVIFISGYAEDAFRKNLDADEEFTFLPKPFSLKQLAEKVKEVMATN